MHELELVEPLRAKEPITARGAALFALSLVVLATFTLSGFPSPVTRHDLDPVLEHVLGSIAVLGFVAAVMYWAPR